MSYDQIEIIEPPFDSSLTFLVIELEHLRKKQLYGSTSPLIFFSLKSIFHRLESLFSARIEGNNTTISELVESAIDNKQAENQREKEIENLQKAMYYIDEHIDDLQINRAFISDLHKMAVKGLDPDIEGDLTPGKYRTIGVSIKGAGHKPPESEHEVVDHMEQLIEFINVDDKPIYDLIKVALVHHRFMWIHPFRNGNGRTGRLLTYAMLIKKGFKVNEGRIINPTAVFCNDRDRYYEQLSKADSGEYDSLLEWCEFVLSGLNNEISKIDHLLDREYLNKNILLPAIDYSEKRELITNLESSILRVAIQSEKQAVKASDLKNKIKSLKNLKPVELSRIIKGLRDKKMLRPMPDSPRYYYISFENSYLLRGVIYYLREQRFLSELD